MMTAGPIPQPGRGAFGRTHQLCALLVAFILSAGAVTAQTGPVVPRGGEHATFTRIVLRLPSATRWSLQQASRQAVLTLSPAPDGFDLSEVFRRIPRTRLGSVRAGAGQLFLELECDCTVTTAQEPSGLLIIDIAEPLTQYPQPDQPRRPLRRPDTSQAAATGTAGQIVAQRRTARQAPPAATTALWEHRLLERAAPAALPSPSGNRDTQTPTVAREIEGVLARQLARAAGQGVVTLRPSTAASTPPLQVLISTEDSPDLAQEEPGLHLRLANKAIADNLMAQITTSDAQECYADDLFDLVAWSETGNFHAELAQHRQHLVSDGNPDSLLTFARFYLYFGFGREASALLNDIRVNTPSDAVLRAVAAILDSRAVAEESPLPDMLHCNGRAALWALLATGAEAGSAEINANAIARSFAELPDHLRRDLGHRVAARLLDHENPDAAQLVRLSMERIGNADAAQVAVTAARIALVENEAMTAPPAASLADLPMTSDSVLLQLEHALTHPEQLNSDLIQTALAYATDLKGTADGARLYALAIEALARQGDFAQAFTTLNRLASAGGIGLPSSLRDAVFDIAATSGSDPQFVTAVFEQQPWQEPERLRPSTRELLADRLADLGFLSHANAITSPGFVSAGRIPVAEPGPVSYPRAPDETVAPPEPGAEQDFNATPDAAAMDPTLPTTPRALGNALLTSSSALRAELQALIAAQ